MKYKIRWQETVTYESVVDIDEDPETFDARDLGNVLDHLNDNEDQWFEQCNTDTDFAGVDDRSLLDVQFIRDPNHAEPARTWTPAHP